MMQDFHQWRHPESIGKTPNIDPPNDIESLLLWRIATCLINSAKSPTHPSEKDIAASEVALTSSKPSSEPSKNIRNW